MSNSDYSRVERAIRHLSVRREMQPSLGELAAAAGLSEFHFQRLFARWAGISPKRFLQFLTLQEAKRSLSESRSLLQATLALGLSSPSRLHELFISLERMSPGTYRSGGAGLTLHWGVAETRLGRALFGALGEGLCGLTFVGDEGLDAARRELEARWPQARFVHAPKVAEAYGKTLDDRLAGERRPLALVLKGTPFQLQVWEALLRIPEGRVLAYGDLARLAGAQGASRAIGTALAQNPIGVLIPCHRVIRSTGAFGDYHWGAPRKQALLALERTHLPAAVA